MQLFKDLTADTENMAENQGQTYEKVFKQIKKFTLLSYLFETIFFSVFPKKQNEIGEDLNDSLLMQKCKK